MVGIGGVPAAAVIEQMGLVLAIQHVVCLVVNASV